MRQWDIGEWGSRPVVLQSEASPKEGRRDKIPGGVIQG